MPVKDHGTANIPMAVVGPIKITGPVVDEEVMVPLATFETPLWPSVDRGARISMRAGGIAAVVVDERMARSFVLQAPNAVAAATTATALRNRREELAEVVAGTSRYARLIGLHFQLVADLLYVRLEISTGDAAGHNMATQAADEALNWVRQNYADLEYVAVSGNFCTDKKVSAVNGILGRGRHVITELTVPGALCQRLLKTTPARLAELNVKKNLIGSVLAGSVRSANAHFANMLLAFYLATGQDPANVVEGSQGIVHAEARGEDLYFSCSIPNIIVGAVGAGKELGFVRDNLAMMGCLEPREAGANARRLAVIAAAATLCGELSLLAALTNPGELMDAHRRLERGGEHG